jgi:hypothetical protein
MLGGRLCAGACWQHRPRRWRPEGGRKKSRDWSSAGRHVMRCTWKEHGLLTCSRSAISSWITLALPITSSGRPMSAARRIPTKRLGWNAHETEEASSRSCSAQFLLRLIPYPFSGVGPGFKRCRKREGRSRALVAAASVLVARWALRATWHDMSARCGRLRRNKYKKITEHLPDTYISTLGYIVSLVISLKCVAR